MPARRGMKEMTTRRRSESSERKVSYSQWQIGPFPAADACEVVRDDDTALYAVPEDKRDRAGRSESVRDEIGFRSPVSYSSPVNRADNSWMRERAFELEMEFVCSSSVVVVAIASPALLSCCFACVSVWDEEGGDTPGIWGGKSIYGGSYGSSPA